jgi:hypothetical protein
LEDPKGPYYYLGTLKLGGSSSACQKYILYIGNSKNNYKEGLGEEGEGCELLLLRGRLPSRW